MGGALHVAFRLVELILTTFRFPGGAVGAVKEEEKFKQANTIPRYASN